MKKITFIRHAESLANAGMVTSDPTQIALSPEGFLQARNLVEKILVQPDLCIVSNYVRTQQTAQPLLQKFPSMRCEIWDMTHEFTYLDKKHCVNMNNVMLKPLIQEYWARNDPYYRDGGNAESFADFIARIHRFIAEARKRPEDTIFVFTHGQFIQALMMLAEGKEYRTSQEFMNKFRDYTRRVYITNASMHEITLIQ